MIPEEQKSEFYREYDLIKARQATSHKKPEAHQSEALKSLHEWFEKPLAPDAGGILVLPTGGGKTFTAVRFLCAQVILQGYKVLWLAHTHHLLEQALESFRDSTGAPISAELRPIFELCRPLQYLRKGIYQGGGRYMPNNIVSLLIGAIVVVVLIIILSRLL